MDRKTKPPDLFSQRVQYFMDRRGIHRGKCLLEDCDCSQYDLPADSRTHLCSYCGDPPTKHLIVHTAESEKHDKEHEAQQSAQVEPVSGTSGMEFKRPSPTTFQQDQSAKKKPKKSNNENEGNVSTLPQESDESGTDEEKKDLCNSDIEMKDQQECFEVEIIQKGPITVGYGGTIKINANIISNSTGSLQVKWQKIRNNSSATLMIDCLKYSGSSCDVNNPQLVINNVDTEDAGIYKLEVISPTETKSSPGILLELLGDEADSLSKEGNNFVRLFFLCQNIATQAVCLFFDSNLSKVPGHTLESFLKQHKSSLTSRISVYRCTKDQEAKLFPAGQVVVASADFDFTLLYKLIRNLLTAIPAPARGWGNQPLPRDLNETDDIERIRCLRNFLTHNSKFEICDTDFSTHWNDLSQAIDRLSKGSLSKDVESMRMKRLDKCIKNEMENDIRKEQKKIQEDVTECKTAITDNKQNIADNERNISYNKQEIHNIRNIPRNIKQTHEKVIKEWKIEDKLYYDKTGGFTAVSNMVKSKKYMTIIGGPGSGKTATARHIALQLEDRGWEVVPVCRLEDIIQYGDSDHKQVFVLDNVLGAIDHCFVACDGNLY